MAQFLFLGLQIWNISLGELLDSVHVWLRTESSGGSSVYGAKSKCVSYVTWELSWNQQGFRRANGIMLDLGSHPAIKVTSTLMKLALSCSQAVAKQGEQHPLADIHQLKCISSPKPKHCLLF